MKSCFGHINEKQNSLYSRILPFHYGRNVGENYISFSQEKNRIIETS